MKTNVPGACAFPSVLHGRQPRRNASEMIPILRDWTPMRDVSTAAKSHVTPLSPNSEVGWGAHPPPGAVFRALAENPVRGK